MQSSKINFALIKVRYIIIWQKCTGLLFGPPSRPICWSTKEQN